MGTRVYVGRLNYDVRERDIEKFFKGYGRIREILIKNGFGFVDFDDYRDADDAVYELNGKELMGERVILEIARGPVRRTGRFGYRRRGGWVDKYREGNVGRGNSGYGPPSRTEYRLIVRNLSSRISWQDLKDFMRQAGEVTYADAHKQNRNEGCVEFATYSDMKKAISKLDGMELNGRQIKLVEDKAHHSSKRSRSRSSSRSRSRSRSVSRSRRRSRSISKSRSKSRSKSHSRSKSMTPRKERKRSHSRSRSRSHDDNNEMKSRSASPTRSRSPSPAKSRSHSPAEYGESSPLRYEDQPEADED